MDAKLPIIIGTLPPLGTLPRICWLFRKTDDERPTTANGRWKTDDGKRKTKDERRQWEDEVNGRKREGSKRQAGGKRQRPDRTAEHTAAAPRLLRRIDLSSIGRPPASRSFRTQSSHRACALTSHAAAAQSAALVLLHQPLAAWVYHLARPVMIRLFPPNKRLLRKAAWVMAQWRARVEMPAAGMSGRAGRRFPCRSESPADQRGSSSPPAAHGAASRGAARRRRASWPPAPAGDVGRTGSAGASRGL